MPEGPEIKQEADRLNEAIGGQMLISVFFAFEHLKSYEKTFIGESITFVEPRGKALLTHLSSNQTIYSHNQLYGKWFVTPSNEPPNTGRSLRLALRSVSADALLYSASEIDVWDTGEVYAHPYVANLGPEVLKPGVRLSSVVKQLENKRFRNRPLGVLLLDQAFVAGIGNYLRSDILHAARLHPEWRPSDLTDHQRHELAQAIRNITRQSYKTGGITNDLRRVRRLKASGQTRAGYRHLAFNRDDDHCYTCGTPIEKIEFAGRRLYLCPACQPDPAC
ncbi:MAG: endonuclease VIII [Gemmatimonadetes bacterium]|jgi:endonuclease-8|nr:endonuclease VIII [Gemmatimonadota bacterium]HCK10837.1 endonuclease VIII [Candidatus Latescibacterota bacterium]|tara:strand:- start:121 stop:951 length:831 start_codon:yes stop_codon:yes gene_type:complete